MTNIESFLIEHIDPLGQGVYKKDDEVYFIPKTLPNESGTFEVLKKKKGVHFARALTISSKSDKRIEPECPHFENCSGCHFLHTDYQSEIEFKINSFSSMLERSKVSLSPNIEAVTSPKRTGYRNRIQLHYNVKDKKIGFFKAQSREIFEVPECRIINPNVKKAFCELLENSQWIKLAKKSKRNTGHVEIYDSPLGLKITWNKRYAHGGFTQVNEEVNKVIQEKIISTLSNPNQNLLDLFAGNGNLSDQISYNERSCVDYFGDENKYKKEDPIFTNLNLFEDEALEKFSQQSLKEFDTFLIDPPRAGFTLLKEWSHHYNPKEIFYVSCHPATMIRDIKPLLDQYTVEQAYLFDLFPSTFHFEGALYLKRKA